MACHSTSCTGLSRYTSKRETVTVEHYPNLVDFAQVDADGVRNVHPSDYKFVFGVREVVEHSAGYVEHTITMV